MARFWLTQILYLIKLSGMKLVAYGVFLILHHGIMKERCKVHGVRFKEFWIESFMTPNLIPYTLNHKPRLYLYHDGGSG